MPEAAYRLIKPDAIMNSKQLGNVFNELLENTKLKSTNIHYNDLFDNMSEGLVVTSTEGIINLVNPQFAKMLGYTTDELIGKNSDEVLLENKSHNNIINNVKIKR